MPISSMYRSLKILAFVLANLLLVSAIASPHKNPDSLSSNEFSAGTQQTLKHNSPSLEPQQINYLLHTFYLPEWERGNAVSLSKDGEMLAVGTSAGIRLFDLGRMEETQVLYTESWARSVAFTPDGMQVAAGVFDHTIRFWNTNEGTVSKTLEGHNDWVRSIAFTSDGTLIASASDDDTVRLWSVLDGKLVHELLTGQSGVLDIAFSPDNTQVAVGAENGVIQVWDVQDGELLNTIKGHSAWERTLTFSHDGQLLASGAFDAVARIWRVSDGALLHELKGHTASVLGIAFSPDDSILATGSVDTSIRLWQVKSGELQNILTGHTGFIYDVAISNDGDYLVSSADDATVRLWDFSGARKAAEVGTAPVSHSGDCRVCHHPASETKPPPVIEVTCEVCHSGGAALNWCPIFPPLLVSPTSGEGSTVSTGNVGIPEPGKALSIHIVTPGNGETVYSHPDFSVPMRVTGQVLQNDIHLSEINVYLEVWSDDEKLITLPGSLREDGAFAFDLGINPNGQEPVQLSSQVDAGAIVCDDCHGEYNTAFYLPEGELQLVVRAVAPNDEIATDARVVNVDVSTEGKLSVVIVDELTGEPAVGITVQAQTRFYEWRPRSVNAQTDENGIASFDLELLSRASTLYAVSIPEQTVNHTYYTGVDTVEIAYPPNESSPQAAELMVRSQRGEIHGRLELPDDEFLESIDVWAINLPLALMFKAEAKQGDFTFQDLPITDYMLFADAGDLETKGLKSDIQAINLTESLNPELILQISPINDRLLNRAITDYDTGWLPFAWLTTLDGRVHAIEPTTGTWPAALETVDQVLMLSAPGFYSQTVELLSVPDQQTQLPVPLERRPEMQSIVLQAGEILIPPETIATHSGNTIDLESGWLWGYGEHDQNMVLTMPGIEITWMEGRFALERLPNRTAWFYLLDGTAEIDARNLDENLTVQPGMIMAILEDGSISEIPFGVSDLSAISPFAESPVSPVWKPTRLGLLQNSVANTLVSTAQAVTLITYLLLLITVIAYPLIMVISRWKKNKRLAQKEHDEHK